MQKAFEELAPN